MHCSRMLIVQTLVFSLSYLHRQVSPPDTLVVKGGTTWARNGRWILPENARLPRNIQGSFTCRKSTTCDKRLYFPSEGRRSEDFFALKNPTASAGFLNPWTWVPKASTLPLDLRSRFTWRPKCLSYCGRDICSTTIQRMQCCASMVTLSVFIILLTSTYVRQQYEWKSLLCFHGSSGYSNAPKCYVIRMLRTFFFFSVKNIRLN